MKKAPSSANWLFIVGVILVTLKLGGVTDVASMPWWTVLLPFYFLYAVVFGIAMLTAISGAILFISGALFYGVVALFEAWHRWWRNRK